MNVLYNSHVPQTTGRHLFFPPAATTKTTTKFSIKPSSLCRSSFSTRARINYRQQTPPLLNLIIHKSAENLTPAISTSAKPHHPRGQGKFNATSAKPHYPREHGSAYASNSTFTKAHHPQEHGQQLTPATPLDRTFAASPSPPSPAVGLPETTWWPFGLVLPSKLFWLWLLLLSRCACLRR